MEQKIKDPKFVNFLLAPHFGKHRHMLVQLFVFLITVDILWYHSEAPLSIWQRLGVWVVYFAMIDSMIYYNACFLVPRFLLKNRFVIYLLLVLGAIAISMAITVFFQYYIYDIASPLWMSITQIFLNTISGFFTMGLIVAGTSAIVLLRHWMQHNQRIDELEATTLQSELKYLKNQINPHFLFNMLNNANVLIKRNPIEASKVLFKLKDLLRYQINDSAREKVTLASEIRFLNDFLNLERIRRDKFEYLIFEEGQTDSIWIQPLLFIPFVENAVKHNFDSENPSYIRLSFQIKDKTLDFHCENSKPVETISGNKVGGIGLANICRRLELLYPGRYLLEISETKQNYIVNLHLEL